MTADAALLTRSFAVGHRTCTITVPQPASGKTACIAVEWHPDVPSSLSRRELHQYRQGRDTALTEISRELGLRTLVVEV